jgi:hypothetical protein
MPETVSSIDITELAEILEDRKSNSQRVGVIIGSRAGALFRSEEFYDELEAYSTRNFADMDHRNRFHECYAILEDIYKRKRMSIKELKSFIEGQIDVHLDVENHLAELVKDAFFKVIITNNIDDILYESFKAVGMRERADFVDFSLGRHSCSDNIERILSQKKINIRRLIRMAGDIDAFIGNLNRPQEKKADGECIGNLLDQLRIRELLIVGIDLAWDQPILSALPSHLETIWFINEDDHVKDKFIEKCVNSINFRYLTGSKGSYEHFFKLLYWNINQSITESHKLIEDVKSNLYNMRIDLNHMQKRNEEINADTMKYINLLQSKMESINDLLEDIFENKSSREV